MWPPDVNSSTYLPPFLQPDGAPHFPPHPTFLGPNFQTFREPKNRFQGIIPPAYVAWRAGTATLFLLCSLPP